MYSLEDIYQQSLKDRSAVVMDMPNGVGVLNNGAKIQKFPSKIEIINLSKGGSYFKECNHEEYNLFYTYGWREGCMRLCIMNSKRKILIVEEKIKNEINTRKNDKHIKKLKLIRENLLIKYSRRQKQINQI